MHECSLFREFDDRPPSRKAAWDLNVFWSKDNPSNIDNFTLKLIVTLYRDTNDQKFFKNTHDEQPHNHDEQIHLYKRS